jgi:hypothetical protein
VEPGDAVARVLCTSAGLVEEGVLRAAAPEPAGSWS